MCANDTSKSLRWANADKMLTRKADLCRKFITFV